MVESILDRLCKAWSFEPIEELPGGHCSRVFASADRVLKIPFQGEEATSGWRMAVAMSGIIGPEVEAVDEATGSLLMERVLPGTKLSEVDISDEEAMDLILDFASQIRMLPMTEGLTEMDRYVDRESPRFLRLQPFGKLGPLHGDLHHENILLGPRGWQVIDPKGLVGEAEFEPSALMRNPIDKLDSEEDLVGLLEKRLEYLESGCGFDRNRVLDWSILALDEEHERPWGRVLSTFIQMRM